MKFKSSYLVVAISLFLVIVFLDQNRNPVPIKIILGNPFHLGLSLVIIISMMVSVIMTLGVIYLVSRKRKK
jgi:uncharacterized integral membrane protein